MYTVNTGTFGLCFSARKNTVIFYPSMFIFSNFFFSLLQFMFWEIRPTNHRTRNNTQIMIFVYYSLAMAIQEDTITIQFPRQRNNKRDNVHLTIYHDDKITDNPVRHNFSYIRLIRPGVCANQCVCVSSTSPPRYDITHVLGCSHA